MRSGLANVNVAQVSMLLRIGERSGIQQYTFTCRRRIKLIIDC